MAQERGHVTLPELYITGELTGNEYKEYVDKLTIELTEVREVRDKIIRVLKYGDDVEIKKFLIFIPVNYRNEIKFRLVYNSTNFYKVRVEVDRKCYVLYGEGHEEYEEPEEDGEDYENVDTLIGLSDHMKRVTRCLRENNFGDPIKLMVGDSYPTLERVAGVKRAEIQLGREPLISAIKYLYKAADLKKNYPATCLRILRITQMLCEPLRLEVMAKFVQLHFENPRAPEDWLLGLQHQWKNSSMRLLSDKEISSSFPIYYGDSRDKGVDDDWLRDKVKALKRYEEKDLTGLDKREEYKKSITASYLVTCFGNYIKIRKSKIVESSDTDLKSGQEVADEEGPPPGWHSVEPNKTSSEQQDIKEGVSCGWTPPAKPKTELQKDMIIKGAVEEGPPAGWNSIGKNNIDREHQDVKEGVSCGWTSPAKLKTELQTDLIIEEGAEEGPPPGWNSIGKNNIDSEQQDIKAGESPAKIKTELENQDILEEGADEEGPPPGWHSTEKDKISSEHQDIKGASHALTSPEKPKTELEKQDTRDEGPPPGWNHVPLTQSKTGSEHQAIKSEGPPHGSHLGPPPQPKSDSIKKEFGEEMPQSMSNSVCQQPKIRHCQQEVEEERSQPGSSSMPPPSPQIQPPMPTTTPMSTASRRPTQSGCNLEMGQMVCGSCRRLLSYARGAKYVKCSCCQTVNLVLKEQMKKQRHMVYLSGKFLNEIDLLARAEISADGQPAVSGGPKVVRRIDLLVKYSDEMKKTAFLSYVDHLLDEFMTRSS